MILFISVLILMLNISYATNQLSGEKIIKIQDRYMFRIKYDKNTGDEKESSFEIFVKNYLPLIPKDALLEFYYMEGNDVDYEGRKLNMDKEDILKILQKHNEEKRSVVTYRMEYIHDRFIWGDKWAIFIGFGTDIFSADGNINKNTGIVFCNKDIFPYPKKPTEIGPDGKSNIMSLQD